MRALLLIACVVAAGCGGDSGGDTYTEAGECAAPGGSTVVTTTAVSLDDPGCLVDRSPELHVVESEAQWQALFDCVQSVPAGIDLAAQRAAVVTINCAPTSFRFAAETAGEVVVGVKTGISGACLGSVVVVPLPRSAKPVRLARCQDVCHGACPPVH